MPKYKNIPQCWTRRLGMILLCTPLCLALLLVSAYGDGFSGVTAANLPLVAHNFCVATPAGQTLAIPLNGHVTAPGVGDTFTCELGTMAPTKGTLIELNGTCYYTSYTQLPSSDGKAHGMDKFSIRAVDNRGGVSNEVMVTVLNDGAVRIMALGDSITQGVNMGNRCTGTIDYHCPQPPSNRISYRKRLFDRLSSLNTGDPSYSVRMVGSTADGSTAGLASPNDEHEGHPGWCAGPNGANAEYCKTRSIADNIYNWLNMNPADIILVHVGTNSFTTSVDDVKRLLDEIDRWASDNYPVTVFLADILQDVQGRLDVTTFNSNVRIMVENRPESSHIIMVNQQTGAGIDYSYATDMGDDFHPQASGYDKMADKWFSDMTNSANVGPNFIGLPQCQ
jgi:GDSL-like Lipase/Acylhydrolase